MDAATLHRAINGVQSADWCASHVAGLNQALALANCTTVNRVAMFVGQCREESANYNASSEYASGAEYNWRDDLGNTQAGDGERFKGRTFIQVTGRNNYGAFSRWAYGRGLCPNNHYFVDNPAELATTRYVWDGPAWYWLGNHDHGYGSINLAADHWDLSAATYMINGAQNGLDAREQYCNQARAIGAALLTHTPAKTSEVDMFTYNAGGSCWLFAPGQRVHKVGKDYAANIAKVTGRPTVNMAWAMHKRMVTDQIKAVKGL